MLLTIGHSTHPLPVFLDLLHRHRVRVVVDVRSHPASRFAPRFDRTALAGALAAAGIGYDFRGAALGARSADPSCYEDGRADYGRIAATAAFRRAGAEVAARAIDERTCLLCAERDPLSCHRTFLVGVRLRSVALPLAHIQPDGSLELHQRTEERLLAHHRLAGPDLLRSPEECLAEAYGRHERLLAYRRPAAANGDSGSSPQHSA